MKERYKCAIVVDLMLIRENDGKKEVLLALRKNTGYCDGEYELPGGHLEAEEDIFDAMIRESKEELNIELKREDLKIEHILHHYKGNRIKFLISARKYDGTLQVGEPDKCEKLDWFDINKLPDNTEKRARRVLEEIQNGVFYDNSDFINHKIK